jgi:gas vesicle protein
MYAPGAESTAPAHQANSPGLQAIDSLNLSLQFLDRIAAATICPFQEDVITRTESLQEEYEKLVKLADKLEEQAPELRQQTTLNKIRAAGSVGMQSLARINNLAFTGQVLVPDFLAAAGSMFEPHDFISAAATLESQKASITLSAKAADTLRALLRAIKDVYAIVLGANTAAKELREVSRGISDKVSQVRGQIYDAVSALADLNKNGTFEKLNNVAEILTAFDSMYEKRLNSLSEKAQKRCKEHNRGKLPGEFLREYLQGTRELISEEITYLHDRYDLGANAWFVKASSPAGPGISDIIALVARVLREKLIEDTETRRKVGAGYVRPLVRYKGQTRIDKFREALSELVPQGKYDRDESKLKEAAELLNRLLVEKNW